MIDIGRLRLNLPAGYQHRAATLARMVGQALARLPLSGQGSLEYVKVSGVTLRPGQSDGQVAAQIATAIATQIQQTGRRTGKAEM